MKKFFLIVAATFISFSLSAQFTENPAGSGVLTTSDRVGINTTTLDNTENNSYKLTIKGGLNVGGTGNARIKVRHIDGKDYKSSAKANLYLNWNTGDDVVIGHHSTGTKSDLLVSGKVRIGNSISTPAGYQLYVKDGILTEKVKIATHGTTYWADYVFDEDYDLNEIEEVKAFVQENKHLPNVPSTEEVNANGINVAEMDATLLRQIEELWLHVIEMNEKLERVESENAALKAEIKELQN